MNPRLDVIHVKSLIVTNLDSLLLLMIKNCSAAERITGSNVKLAQAPIIGGFSLAALTSSDATFHIVLLRTLPDWKESTVLHYDHDERHQLKRYWEKVFHATWQISLRGGYNVRMGFFCNWQV